MFRILVVDVFPEEKLEKLRKEGHVVDYLPQSTEVEFQEKIKWVHVLCVRSTKITQAILEKAENLLLVIRVGSGTNNIDVSFASQQGIFVSNCPGKNSIAVAELTMGLLLASDRRLPQAHNSLESGNWEKDKYSIAQGIYGKTLGLVGFGQIAKEVAKRARAFGLKVLVWTRSPNYEESELYDVQFCKTLEELCKKSDMVSIHLPLSGGTRKMFNQESFSWMKPDSIFINTSRGEIHDENALAEAIRTKGLRVGLDVFEQEKQPFLSPVLGLESTVLTPHIGASTQQAQLAVAEEAIRILRVFQKTGEAPHCINLQVQQPIQSKLIVRHLNKVGVLASILTLLQKANINVESMENTIFETGIAAFATIHLSQALESDLLLEIQNSSVHILQVESISL